MTSVCNSLSALIRDCLVLLPAASEWFERREAVALYRRWQLLACWPPLGTVVGGLVGDSGQPGNSARSRQLGSAGWATVAVPGPLHFGSDNLPAESSGSSWQPRITCLLLAMSPPPSVHPQYTLSTPSVHPQHTHVTHITPTLSTPLKPTLSSPVWPHALLYKNPFPQFDEREGWNSSHTSIQI